ncbi:MAG TPA: hypothetical protein VFW29_01695 [Solirubrobacteraceae bacterium]|nr:hypothetical protein [Solirubrobacteraceae bacterium]
MYLVGHIGNIPVEEWLPFLVPIIALYLFGRRRDRRRRSEVRRLPDAGDLLDDRAVEQVLARWREGRHPQAAARHLPLLYPPGPDEMTIGQLAGHARSDPRTVRLLLDELEDLGYVELDGEGGAEQSVSLTIEGYDLVHQTESVLLSIARERRAQGPDAPR